MSNYVDPKKLSIELGEWSKLNRARRKCEKPLLKMTDYIGECVFLICNNMAYKSSFINYTYKDEMTGDAIENCIRYLINFDPEVNNNAFGYVSTVVYWAFVRRIKKEKQRHIDHLSYIRKTFVEDDIRNAINSDNPNDVKVYTTYIDNLQSILDDMNIPIPEKPERKARKPKKGLLDDIMTGDDY